MGIQDLFKHIKEKCKDCVEEVHMSEFKNKKVIVDGNGFLYTYGYGGRKGTIFQQFAWMVYDIRSMDGDLAVVFDGKAPKWKQKTKEIRQQLKQKQLEKKENLEKEMKTIEDNLAPETTEKLKNFNPSKDFLLDLLIEDENTSIQQSTSNEEVDQKLRYMQQEHKYDQCLKSEIVITPELIEQVKNFLKQLQVCVIQAVEEAEPLCAILNRLGIFDYVLSEDSDVFAFGGKYLITGFSWKGQRDTKMRGYSLSKILNSMKLNQEQFISVCTLTGNDYNKDIKIPQMGFVRALKCIQTWGNLTKFFQEWKKFREKYNEYLSTTSNLIEENESKKEVQEKQKITLHSGLTFILPSTKKKKMTSDEKLLSHFGIIPEEHQVIFEEIFRYFTDIHSTQTVPSISNLRETLAKYDFLSSQSIKQEKNTTSSTSNNNNSFNDEILSILSKPKKKFPENINWEKIKEFFKEQSILDLYCDQWETTYTTTSNKMKSPLKPSPLKSSPHKMPFSSQEDLFISKKPKFEEEDRKFQEQQQKEQLNEEKERMEKFKKFSKYTSKK